MLSPQKSMGPSEWGLFTALALCVILSGGIPVVAAEDSIAVSNRSAYKEISSETKDYLIVAEESVVFRQLHGGEYRVSITVAAGPATTRYVKVVVLLLGSEELKPQPLVVRKKASDAQAGTRGVRGVDTTLSVTLHRRPTKNDTLVIKIFEYQHLKLKDIRLPVNQVINQKFSDWLKLGNSELIMKPGQPGKFSGSLRVSAGDSVMAKISFNVFIDKKEWPVESTFVEKGGSRTVVVAAESDNMPKGRAVIRLNTEKLLPLESKELPITVEKEPIPWLGIVFYFILLWVAVFTFARSNSGGRAAYSLKSIVLILSFSIVCFCLVWLVGLRYVGIVVILGSITLLAFLLLISPTLLAMWRLRRDNWVGWLILALPVVSFCFLDPYWVFPNIVSSILICLLGPIVVILSYYLGKRMQKASDTAAPIAPERTGLPASPKQEELLTQAERKEPTLPRDWPGINWDLRLSPKVLTATKRLRNSLGRDIQAGVGLDPSLVGSWLRVTLDNSKLSDFRSVEWRSEQELTFNFCVEPCETNFSVQGAITLLVAHEVRRIPLTINYAIDKEPSNVFASFVEQYNEIVAGHQSEIISSSDARRELFFEKLGNSRWTEFEVVEIRNLDRHLQESRATPFSFRPQAGGTFLLVTKTMSPEEGIVIPVPWEDYRSDRVRYSLQQFYNLPAFSGSGIIKQMILFSKLAKTAEGTWTLSGPKGEIKFVGEDDEEKKVEPKAFVSSQPIPHEIEDGKVVPIVREIGSQKPTLHIQFQEMEQRQDQRIESLKIHFENRLQEMERWQDKNIESLKIHFENRLHEMERRQDQNFENLLQKMIRAIPPPMLREPTSLDRHAAGGSEDLLPNVEAVVLEHRPLSVERTRLPTEAETRAKVEPVNFEPTVLRDFVVTYNAALLEVMRKGMEADRDELVRRLDERSDLQASITIVDMSASRKADHVDLPQTKTGNYLLVRINLLNDVLLFPLPGIDFGFPNEELKLQLLFNVPEDKSKSSVAEVRTPARVQMQSGVEYRIVSKGKVYFRTTNR